MAIKAGPSLLSRIRNPDPVGAGAHTKLASPAGTYAFSRTFGQDAVVVVLTAPKP